MGKLYQSKFQTFPIPLFDRDFYAAKTYLFPANLYELLLMNRNAFIKNCLHFPLKILKQVFSGGGRLPSVRKPHIMPPRSIFASKTKRNCILGMSAYETGTKSKYQHFRAWFQITLPQTSSPSDQPPLPGPRRVPAVGPPQPTPCRGAAPGLQSARRLAKKKKKKNAIRRSERAREHAKPAAEEHRVIYLDFSQQHQRRLENIGFVFWF